MQEKLENSKSVFVKNLNTFSLELLGVSLVDGNFRVKCQPQNFVRQNGLKSFLKKNLYKKFKYPTTIVILGGYF